MKLKQKISAFVAVSLTAGAALALTISPGAAQQSQHIIELKKTASCGCCTAWAKRMQAAGFKVRSEDMTTGGLMQFKLQHGIRSNFACHTARLSGYTIEGHVPDREIRRLLRERPDAIGLSVPGMPLGSPGMDFGNSTEAYDVFLVRNDGSKVPYAHYPKKN